MSPATELRKQALAVAAGLRPETLTGEQAAAVVRDLATTEKAVATARMFAAVRVAQTDAWRGQGHLSAADWLAAQVGISVGEAAAQLGTAKKAARLPKTEEQMRKGKLSPSQAGAVTEGATADPSAEEDLLGSAANDTTAELKRKAAAAKAAAMDSKAREARIRSQRSVRSYTDGDGAFHLHLRGPSVDGARIQALLRPHEEQAFRQGRSCGVRDTFENRSYDAFLSLLGLGPNPMPATDPQPDGHHGSAGQETDSTSDQAPQATRPRPTAGGDNIKVIVRIDHEALMRGHTIAGETCEVAGLGPIAVAAARELMDDAFVAVVLTKGRDVVNVAHVGRRANAFQRTALEWTGLRCTNVACNRTIAVQVDHRTPWSEAHETALDNLDPLCPDCHRRKTHRGWALEPGTGRRAFRPPSQPSQQTQPSQASPPSPPSGRAPEPPGREGPARSGTSARSDTSARSGTSARAPALF